MKRSIHLSIFIAILLAVLVSAALPGVAYADEGTPPTEPTPTTESSEPAAEETAVEEAPVVEETPTVDETAPVEETPAVEESTNDVTEPETEAISEEGTLTSEVPLAELPEGTELVVLDENGEALSLASEEAAELISTSDPRWCPVGVTPPATLLASGGCSPAFDTMSGLIDWLEDDANDLITNKAGVIWIHEDYDSGTATEFGFDDTVINLFTLDGANVGNMDNFALTIKGGWTGSGTGIDTTNPSEFNAALHIINWNGDITLSDILITQVTENAAALLVQTAGKISLTRVDVTDLLDVDNHAAASLTNSSGNKDVIVTSSEFLNNETGSDSALVINSNGLITLSSVTASSNFGGGAILNNSGVSAKDVVVNNSTFSDNDATGLSVISSGKITIANVIAENNDSGDGANLINYDGTKDVVISNSSFINNGVSGNGKGLNVETQGIITITNLTAIGNTEWGAWLDNCDFDEGFSEESPADDTCSNAVAKNVILLGTNILGDNEYGGLAVYSLGAININNLISNSNDGWGALLFNHKALTNQPVTLTKYSEFKYNQSGGLEIVSKGTVTLYYINASNNVNATEDDGGQGLYINNTNSTSGAGVSLFGTNIFNDNFLTGLEILSKGAISLNNVTANGNGTNIGGGGGAILSNSDADSPKPVKITGTNQFIGNYNDNLKITSIGAVSLNNITANGSIDGYGADIENADYGDPLIQQNVILTGVNSFSGNFEGGLDLESSGAVTIYKINASGNMNQNGAYIDNAFGTLPRNVYIIGYGAFNENGGKGLEIYSEGSINIANLTANENDDLGAELSNNITSTSQQNITLTGITSASDNTGNSGLFIRSYGVVSLANATASGNGNFGMYVQNNGGTLPKNVTLSGTNDFSGNAVTGLYLLSDGAISISKVTASSNGTDIDPGEDPYEEFGFGIYLNNLGNSLVPQNVTLSGYVTVVGNVYSGLEVHTYGTITAANITVDNNGQLDATPAEKYGYGALLNNDDGSLVRTVNVSGSNSFDGNYSGGLFVESDGAVTLSSLSASSNTTGNGLNILTNESVTASNLSVNENGGYGAYIDNSAAATPKPLSISGTNEFNKNELTGLYVKTDGAIKLNNVTASDNGSSVPLFGLDPFEDYGYGVYLLNSETLTTPQAVTLSGYLNVEDNFYSGIEVDWSYGAILAYNVTATHNGWDGSPALNRYGYGAVFNNYNVVGTPQAVTLNGTNAFIENWNDGLSIESAGIIKVNNLTASQNLDYGVVIDNSNAGSAQSVTFTGTNSMEENGNTGLLVFSRGAVSISKISAINNGHSSSFHSVADAGSGIFIDNTLNTLPEAPQNVTFTGYVNAIENFTHGFYVNTLGAILASNITATDNGIYEDLDTLFGGFGAYLVNNTGSLVRPITINGTNVFSENYDGGLEIRTYGAIKLYSLTAVANFGTGVYLENYSAPNATVTLIGSHYFNSNVGNGLEVLSSKTITLSNLTATYNEGNGVLLVNEYSGNSTPADVKVAGTNIFSVNGYSGLVVLSYGAVTLNNLTAEENGWLGGFSAIDPLIRGYGVLVDGCRASQFDLQDCSATISKTVSITGTNSFNGNVQDGLLVQALGLIKANALSAEMNDGAGVSLLNQFDQALPGAVTLSGTNTFIDNAFQGLTIFSHRAITLSNITANLNTDSGATLSSMCASFEIDCSLSKITLSGANTFNDNGDLLSDLGVGLSATTNGNITINNLTANGNGFQGASLSNSNGVALVSINLTGTNNFIGNGTNGLTFSSTGNVAIAKITADGNEDGDGVFGTADGNITITCGSMTNNGDSGFVLSAGGTLTLKGVVSLGNGGVDSYFGAMGESIVRSC